MNKILLLFVSTFASVAAMTTTQAETFSFDRDEPGAPPAGWRSGVTGRGSPKWSVEADASAPSRPNVLKQSGSGTFPWCVRPEVSLENGYVEVKFKPVSGRETRPEAGWGGGRAGTTTTSRGRTGRGTTVCRNNRRAGG